MRDGLLPFKYSPARVFPSVESSARAKQSNEQSYAPNRIKTSYRCGRMGHLIGDYWMTGRLISSTRPRVATVPYGDCKFSGREAVAVGTAQSANFIAMLGQKESALDENAEFNGMTKLSTTGKSEENSE